MSELCIDNDEGDVFDLFIGLIFQGSRVKLNTQVQIQKFLAKLFSASVLNQVNWMGRNGKSYSQD